MKEYTILSDSNFAFLIVEVNNKMQEGWEPIGGVVFVRNDLFLQSLIREIPSEPKKLPKPLKL